MHLARPIGVRGQRQYDARQCHSFLTPFRFPRVIMAVFFCGGLAMMYSNLRTAATRAMFAISIVLICVASYLFQFGYLHALASGVGIIDFEKARQLLLLGATLRLDTDGYIVEIDFTSDVDSDSVSDVGDECLQHILGLEKLRCLTIGAMSVTESGVQSLATLKELVHLSVTVPNDKALSYIGELAELRSLRVAGDVTGAGFRTFSKSSRLNSLVVFDAKSVSKDIYALNSLTSLRRLAFVHTPITDGLIIGLRETFGRLFEFSAFDSKIADDGASVFCDLPTLEVLRLARSGVTDVGVGRMQGLPSLSELVLAHTKTSDGCVRSLEMFTQLKKISVWGTAMTSDGRHRLKQSLRDVEISESFRPY